MVKAHFPDHEFQAYLFDFDGTIADTMPPHLEAWNKALGVYGLSLSREQHMAWAGRPTREIVKLLNEMHSLEMSIDEIAKTKENFYLSSVDQVRGILPVMEIIKVAQGKIPMAVVSGSRRRPVQATMEFLGISDLFDALVCAEDYQVGKPDPECFLKAASLLQVKPENCLVFEDAELGIQAAHAAGMACLRIIEDSRLGHQLQKASRP